MTIPCKRSVSRNIKDIDGHPATRKLKTIDAYSLSFNDDQGSDHDRSDSGSGADDLANLASYNSLLCTLPKKKKQRVIKRERSTSAKILLSAVHGSSEKRLQKPLSKSSNDDDAWGKSDESADDRDVLNASDPYHHHLVSDSSEVASRLDAAKNNSWTAITSKIWDDSNLYISVPGTVDAEITFGKGCTLPQHLWLKRRLLGDNDDTAEGFDATQKALAPYLLTYHDILFSKRNVSNAGSLRRICCLHALNHVFKTRNTILKNSEKRARYQDGEDIETRDQGFTRPKVLFLLETRQNCYKYASLLSSLAKPDQEEHKKRLVDNFYLREDKFKSDDPEDFRELFEGNDDNNFRLGIKLTRKTIKYFANFYSSDILLASPLGLRSAIENKGKKDYDFLSSIEILFIDQADAMLMQNWEHVDFVLDHLNLQPKETRGCDFGRVRKWYLDGDAQYFRQTVICSAYITPEINRLFTKRMRNYAGKIKFQPSYGGTMLDLDIPVKQIFLRINSPTPELDPNVRFEAFASAIVPLLTKSSSSEKSHGMLVFIPSYFDFVRVRNYLSSSGSTHNLSFGAVSEYSEHAEIRRARSLFIDGRHSVLLYTGRAHHFRRYRLKGVKSIIMYSLPDNASFYSDIVRGFIGYSVDSGQVDPSLASVRILFSQWDALKLERVVGSTRMRRMLQDSHGDIFEFR